MGLCETCMWNNCGYCSIQEDYVENITECDTFDYMES